MFAELRLMKEIFFVVGVALVPGTEYIVSIFANTSCEAGLLKKKLVTLVEYLEEPLSQLAQDQASIN